MIAVADANIPATEPVITLELARQAPRAYPLRYMTWHEIVNDGRLYFVYGYLLPAVQFRDCF